ncbi:hypothetical protein JCM6882_001736 [Rhodosporidiobolus microsporus]
MATAPLILPQSQAQVPGQPPSSFYKRPLPSTCTSFASSRGKQLFAKALAEGNMEAYFTLAGALEQQSDPAYCGLGTLCSILNALEVDPQRKWRGPWRWYDQTMLDCCRPLTDIAAVGITLSEFTCLARCNGLRAKLVSPLLSPVPTASSSSPYAATSSAPPSLAQTPDAREAGIARFRSDVKNVCSSDGKKSALAISYSRRTLGQTGDGHFSPIGGYCEEEDMVLILDVARFKYPAYWIPTSLAYDSMIPLDNATGQPRGYVLLDVVPQDQPGSLGGPLSTMSLTLNKSSWSALSNSLQKSLFRLSSSSSAPLTAQQILDAILSPLSDLPTPAISPRPRAPSPPSSFAPSSANEGRTTPNHHHPHALLLDTLSTTRLAALTPFASSPNPNHLLSNLLLSIALLSPRSSLAALVPPGAGADELHALIREALGTAPPSTAEGGSASGGETEGIAVIKEEVDFLVKQVGALGECCRSEEEGGAVCGCAGPKLPRD